MTSTARRVPGTAITFMLALGFQFWPFRNLAVAITLWMIAAGMSLWTLTPLLQQRRPDALPSLPRQLARLRAWSCHCLVQNSIRADLILVSRGDKQRRIAGLECRVWDEYGNGLTFRCPPEMGSRSSGITVSYPADFPLARRPVASGTYRVEWRVLRRFWHTARRTIARCKFTISPGLPGWFVLCEPININGEDQVTIFLHHEAGAQPLRGLTCQVTDPIAARLTFAVERSKAADRIAAGAIPPQATYPKDFEGAPLVEGTYRGKWTAWAPDAPVAIQGRRILVREFKFDWPNLSASDQLEEHR